MDIYDICYIFYAIGDSFFYWWIRLFQDKFYLIIFRMYVIIITII